MKRLRLFICGALLALLCGSAQASYFDQIQLVPGVTGGASLSSVIAPATVSVQTVKSSAGNVYGLICFNILATPVYVHVFDLAAGSITLGTTSASYQFMCPGNTAGAGFVIPLAVPVGFANAINYVASLNIAATDHTAITASSVIVDVIYN